MQDSSFLINILRGASWALVIIIPLYLFFRMFYYGLFLSISSAIFGAFVSLFFVLFVEIADIQIKNFKLKEEQIKLLKEINSKIK